MPTATGAGTPRNSTRTGTVTVPAPTPVSAINSAMKNPMTYCIVLATQFLCFRAAYFARRCLNVNPALHFAAGPTARSRIVGIERQRRAWLAADRCVAALIKRQQRNPKLLARVPNVARRPLRQRRQLQHLLAAGQRKHRRLFERGAAPCLLAAQAGEPHAIPGHSLEQWFNLAQPAAAVRRGLIEQADIPPPARLLFFPAAD